MTTDAAQPRTLSDILHARSVTQDALALRTDLHPEDVCDDFRTIGDVALAGVLGMYDRMQDGPRIGDDAVVLSFLALPGELARLTACRRFSIRPEGLVPGDIVYDYDAAHLLHSFIARAARPTFYDAVDVGGLEALIGKLIVRWPSDENCLRADHDTLLVVSDSGS